MSSPKALPGQVSTPGLKPHSWGPSSTEWLNNPHGGKTCTACGCTMEPTGNPLVIQADVKYEGRWYYYTDCLGNRITSSLELSCPVFAAQGGKGDPEAKELGRRAKLMAEQVEGRILGFEARVIQLEQENAALREQVGRVQQIDLTRLAQTLLELAAQAKENQALGSVRTEAGLVQIPKQLLQVIDVIGIPVEEPSSSEESDADEEVESEI